MKFKIILKLALTIYLAMIASGCVSNSPRNVFNGNTYVVVNTLTNWSNAMIEAERRGGHLVTINSAEENSFVLNLIQKEGTLDAYWIGGQLAGNQWEWVTGEPFQYTNWSVGNPDNYQGLQNRIAIMRVFVRWNERSYAQPGQWDDDSHTSMYGFIIKIPML